MCFAKDTMCLESSKFISLELNTSQKQMVKLNDSFGFIKIKQMILWKESDILYLRLYVLMLHWQFVDF